MKGMSLREMGRVDKHRLNMNKRADAFVKQGRAKRYAGKLGKKDLQMFKKIVRNRKLGA